MDVAELQGGQTLGIFKTVVEAYSESEQNYEDYLKDVWQATAFANDSSLMRRLVKLTLGGHR